MHPVSSTEDHTGESNRSSSCSKVANSVLVPCSDENAVQTTNSAVSYPTSSNSPRLSREAPSMSQKNVPPYMLAIRKHLEDKGHSQDTISIVLASWREGTKSQYQSSLNKWISYCDANDISVLSPDLPQALDFLSKLYNENASYSTINTAKSALSSLLQLDSDIPFGQLPLVKRFMKGIFEQRPSFPKHQEIWDVKLVFDYFRTQPSVANLTLKELSMKTTFLLCLLSGQRSQSIKLLDISHMNVLPDRYIFHISSKVKQTRPGKHLKLEFITYPAEEKLCIVKHLNEYISRTSTFWKESMKQLLLGFRC